jgi:hypothetical protein
MVLLGRRAKRQHSYLPDRNKAGRAAFDWESEDLLTFLSALPYEG